MSDERYLGWYWLADNRPLRYGPSKQEICEGSVQHYSGKPLLCKAGLHWSPRCIDTLDYAPGNIVCRVEAWGDTVHGDGKSVSQYRKVLWMFNAERVLWTFLCDVAEDALLLAEVTDPRSWAATALRRKWLDGHQVTARQWSAARGAALAVAGDTKNTAVRAAAEAAAKAVITRSAVEIARNAVCDARYVAWTIANNIVWNVRDVVEDDEDATFAAVKEVVNNRLEALIFAEARKQGKIDS